MSRLLLIDDDPDLILDQLEHVYAPQGVKIVTAASGAEGLRKFAALHPDVVLLDVRLPDLSGLEVYRQIHQLDARMPVVFITATTTAETAIEADQAGGLRLPVQAGRPGAAHARRRPGLRAGPA